MLILILFSKVLLVPPIMLSSQISRKYWRSSLSRFFHTSTLIRRHSNAVDFLQTDSGAWVSKQAEIGGNFVQHFSNLFSSSSLIIEDEMLNLFSPSITPEENNFLCTIPLEEEIVQALASLGSTKALGLDGFTILFYKKH